MGDLVTNSDSPSPSYHYPFAAAPDIIRSHQKDAYFEGVLLNHLSTLLRKLYGARFLHTYTSEARTFSELLYLSLTTFIGNRTLGEEYCDVIQIEDDTLKLPTIGRRSGYILTSILLPYSINKILPHFRSRIRAKLERNINKSEKQRGAQNSKSYKIQSYLLQHLTPSTAKYAAARHLSYKADTPASPSPNPQYNPSKIHAHTSRHSDLSTPPNKAYISYSAP